MFVLPNIYQFKIPLPNNPLGTINSYLVKTPEGCLLIDTGWNTDEAFDSLEQQMEGVGVHFSDLKYIAITHIHPDHYGLVGRIERHAHASLIVHDIERTLLNSRYVNYQELLNEMDLWLAINGVPPDVRPKLQRASLDMLGLVEVALPDHVVHGGEQIRLGEYTFTVLWTPGHSPGHICLYEERLKILFSGDHIMLKTTPNVSMNSQTISNPLVDYLNALKQVSELPVELVLPGHWEPFTDLAGRVKEIRQHHDKRLAEMADLFVAGPKTAYQVAVDTPWYLPWNALPSFNKRMAVTETLSHLELLFARGQLEKTLKEGVVWYAAAQASADV